MVQRKIQRLSKTYMALKLSDFSENIKNPGEEIFKMVVDGKISARIDIKNFTV